MAQRKECFPDGTSIDEWFYDVRTPNLEMLGTRYVITDYGVLDDGKVYTKEIQMLIDLAAKTGGVIFVPKGTYRTGALFFKQGVNLYIEENGVLMGSDDISDYPLCETRIEGESCRYFSALINVDGTDGFTMFGKGVIDGNGLRSWRAFWKRLEWNPKATNKDEQRPRLVYISNSSNVTISGVTLQNSHFWTSHIYRCNRVRYLNCRFLSPNAPVRAPSTDGIDVDACSDVLIKGCYFAVNDDAVAFKGGKGPTADKMPINGANERILIEDCNYGFCHSCLTLGSESIHNKNILARRLKVSNPVAVFVLKIRPDTPQWYEYVTIEDVNGEINTFLRISSWKQYFDMQGVQELPWHIVENIVVRNCACVCDQDVRVVGEECLKDIKNFRIENVKLKTKEKGFDLKPLNGFIFDDVTIFE